MKYSNPVYMFTEKTVAELREEVEREAEREIKSEEDYERAVRAEKMRVELWEMEQEAIDYGYGINTGAATPAALITFIDYRKALAEQRNGDGPAPDLVRRIGELADIVLAPTPGRPGPKPGNRAERIEARLRWEAIKNNGEMTLEQWLERMYGTHPDGALVVPKSTFYSWPKR
jgi:hypothetical protein